MNKFGLTDFNLNELAVEPLEKASTIPSAWYTDPGYHSLDREWIFSRTWQLAGYTHQLNKPGDYFLTQVAENPIIVLKDQDNSIRAFYNVCRHRGGPLAFKDGHASKLRCNYHGWTYDLDGTLKGTPEFDGVENFKTCDYGLNGIHVETWEGLIFVNLEKNPQPLSSVVGGITERILPIKVSELNFHSRVTYDVKCNWKVYIDNFQEAYHLNMVHPELVGALDYKQYVTILEEEHIRSYQYSPIRPEENMYGSGAAEVFYYWLYPNMMLNIMPNRLQVNIIVPVSHDRTQVIFDYFYTDLTSNEARRNIAKDLEASELIQQQDIDICEHVQKGLNSRTYDKGRFSVKRETGVYLFQNLVKASYKKAYHHFEESCDASGLAESPSTRKNIPASCR